MTIFSVSHLSLLDTWQIPCGLLLIKIFAPHVLAASEVSNVFEQIFFVNVLPSSFGCFQGAASYPAIAGCGDWDEAILNGCVGRAVTEALSC